MRGIAAARRPSADSRADSAVRAREVVLRLYAMAHTVHYPVLSAGQVSSTSGRGTAVDRLLKVLSTARYRAPQATEGKGAGGHQVLQVSVRTVHRPRYGHALTTQLAESPISGSMYVFCC